MIPAVRRLIENLAGRAAVELSVDFAVLRALFVHVEVALDIDDAQIMIAVHDGARIGLEFGRARLFR